MLSLKKHQEDETIVIAFRHVLRFVFAQLALAVLHRCMLKPPTFRRKDKNSLSYLLKRESEIYHWEIRNDDDTSKVRESSFRREGSQGAFRIDSNQCIYWLYLGIAHCQIINWHKALHIKFGFTPLVYRFYFSTDGHVNSICTEQMYDTRISAPQFLF